MIYFVSLSGLDPYTIYPIVLFNFPNQFYCGMGVVNNPMLITSPAGRNFLKNFNCRIFVIWN